MNLRAILVVLLAIACGISAAIGINQIRGPRVTAVAAGPVDTQSILVARNDIPIGAMVTEQDIVVRDWPKDLAPIGAITNKEDVADRATIMRVLSGEPLMDSKLSEKGAGGGMQVRIPVGMRAYTINTPQVASNVAGFVLPGSRVDILLNLRRSGRNDTTGGGSTTTLLQAVEVLAVGQLMETPSENKVDPGALRSVTLLVTPQQAARLSLGQGAGSLTLSLRRAGDLSEAKADPEELANLWRKQEGPNDFTGSWMAGALGAVAKAVTVPRTAEVEEPPEDPKKQTEVYLIRTLRGISRGQVHVNVRD